MLIAVVGIVFLAVFLSVVAVYWWTAEKSETLPERIKGIVRPEQGAEPSLVGRAKAWVGKVRARLSARAEPGHDDIVAAVTAGGVTGARLLLYQAGYRTGGAYAVYNVIRIVTPVLLCTVGVGYGKLVGQTNQSVMLLGICGIVFGLLLPEYGIRRKIRKRQEDIIDSLPDGLDLLVVCVEAGMGLNAAFVKLSEEFRLTSPVLSEEFDVVNREMIAGKPRQEALRALAERTGVEDVKSLVAMLVQTDKLGTSLAQSLRVHSDSLRTRRRQRAEEAAAKTTIKLMFPLVFFLFPAMFIVLLGPGIIQVIKVLFPAMRGGG